MTTTTEVARLIRLSEVEERVGLKKTAIYNLISLGQFPRPVRLGSRSVAWVNKEVAEWVGRRIELRDEMQVPA
jgi:prophage regulatory protein